MNDQPDHYGNAIAALKRLAASDDLRESERRELAKELEKIGAMVEKLEAGRIEIAVYGEVNAGKSALLNALLGKPEFPVAARAGETRDIAKAVWRPASRAFAALGATLAVIDTPGLNEPDGYTREIVAKEIARYADIVLFVTDGDLNDVELDAVKTLHGLRKPVILIINKIDRLTRPQLEEARGAILTRVAGIIAERDIVLAAGDPAPQAVFIVEANGREREEERRRPPMTEDVEARIFAILDQEGKKVAALNASLFASEKARLIAELKVRARAGEASALIEKFMWGKATAVALNPVPWIDIIGVVASDAGMIYMLSEIYGQPVSHENASQLLKEIAGAWGVTGFVVLSMNIMAGAIKTGVPFAGVAITAIPQGAAAAWATYVVGQAATVYFRDGGWGRKGPKTVIKDILRATDKESVLSPLKEKLIDWLKTRPQP